ncbi:NHL repeat-containing protein [Sulfuriflexus sp.]|uniref:NHL repeat-containing protein n=1 Tax=Sulfuriflexus sp. TaxID=2015443 RepID=UPI0028CBF7B2|nr:NHL repeat-containing protein [Sulfuriflexus sp.]MDT8405435.1 NHL repeat-containing protein [Sulfuriflexus sp.]
MRYLFKYTIVAFLLGIMFAAPAAAAKIRHQGTVFVDNVDLALNHPEGVACSDNSFVVADTGNSQVVRYSISVQGFTPEATFPLPGTSPIIAQTNAAGDIFVLDGKSRTIIRMDRDGQVAGKLEPKGLPDPKSFVPRSFKLDKDGNINLLDIFSQRVLVLKVDGTYLRHLPLPEGHGFFSDLAISSQGITYLLDSVAGAIYAANPGAEAFELLSSGLKEHMNFPTSIAIDSRGELYLSDQYGSGLVLVGRDGSFQGRKFGMGWEDGQFYYPAQLCINDSDTLVIADRDNNRVQVFNIMDE